MIISFAIGIPTFLIFPGLLTLLFGNALKNMGSYPFTMMPDTFALTVSIVWLITLGFSRLTINYEEYLSNQENSNNELYDELGGILTKSMFPALIVFAVTGYVWNYPSLFPFIYALLTWLGWCLTIAIWILYANLKVGLTKNQIWITFAACGLLLLFIHFPAIYRLGKAYIIGS